MCSLAWGYAVSPANIPAALWGGVRPGLFLAGSQCQLGQLVQQAHCSCLLNSGSELRGEGQGVGAAELLEGEEKQRRK